MMNNRKVHLRGVMRMDMEAKVKGYRVYRSYISMCGMKASSAHRQLWVTDDPEYVSCKKCKKRMLGRRGHKDA